jgi:hypothetical protein
MLDCGAKERRKATSRYEPNGQFHHHKTCCWYLHHILGLLTFLILREGCDHIPFSPNGPASWICSPENFHSNCTPLALS